MSPELMEAEAEILEPFHLQFSDLLLLSSSSSSSSSSRVLTQEEESESARLQSITDSIMENLGPCGPGLISITGVPRADDIRRVLLPFARNLALLGKKDRARVLKEHGLGTDVPLKNPYRNVSSFALQLKYPEKQSWASISSAPPNIEEAGGVTEENEDVHRLQDLNGLEFKQLRKTFEELGHCMMELGLRLAQACDKAIGGRVLEESIVESSTAKGRLIHYHSVLDNLVLKDINKSIGLRKKLGGPDTLCPALFHGSSWSRNEDGKSLLDILHTENRSTEIRRHRSFSNLWQQWHYDYGIFTVLTLPLFLSTTPVEDYNHVANHRECVSPDGHTYLQLYDSNKNTILLVKSLPGSFIIQVGEAAEILTHGKLRPTLHSVGRPIEFESLSRETFVVFLQPSWNITLSYSGHPSSKTVDKLREGTCSGEDATLSSFLVESRKPCKLMQEILQKIPPLSSRLRDGMTFAEFSCETTKQYYGGSGTQSGDK